MNHSALKRERQESTEPTEGKRTKHTSKETLVLIKAVEDQITNDFESILLWFESIEQNNMEKFLEPIVDMFALKKSESCTCCEELDESKPEYDWEHNKEPKDALELNYERNMDGLELVELFDDPTVDVSHFYAQTEDEQKVHTKYNKNMNIDELLTYIRHQDNFVCAEPTDIDEPEEMILKLLKTRLHGLDRTQIRDGVGLGYYTVDAALKYLDRNGLVYRRFERSPRGPPKTFFCYKL